jgi:hypothetical protein
MSPAALFTLVESIVEMQFTEEPMSKGRWLEHQRAAVVQVLLPKQDVPVLPQTDAQSSDPHHVRDCGLPAQSAASMTSVSFSSVYKMESSSSHPRRRRE